MYEHASLSIFPLTIFIASIVICEATMAFVVAMAWMMFPAMPLVSKRLTTAMS